MAKVYDNATDLITFARSSSGTALRRVGYGDDISVPLDQWARVGDAATTLTYNAGDGSLDVDAATTLDGAIANLPGLEAGKVYIFEANFTLGTSGDFRLTVGPSYTNFVRRQTSGTVQLVFTAQDTNVRIDSYSGTGTFTINSVSVREVIFDRPTDDLVLFNHPDDIPRIEYAADGSLKGLLIEEQRTNLITNSTPQSGDLATSGGSFSYVTCNFTPLSGLGVHFDTTGVTSYVYFRPTHTVDDYTFSVFVEMDDGNAPTFGSSISPDASNDFAFVVDGGPVNPASYIVEHYGGSTYRVSGTRSSVNTTARNAGLIKYSGNSSRTFKVTGFQLEEGSFPTSYIPTSGSTVTRSPDIASIPVSAFGYNQDAGAVVVEASFNSRSDGQTFHRTVELSNGPSSRLAMFDDANESNEYIRYFVRDDTASNVFGAANLSGSDQSEVNLAIAYAADDMAIYGGNGQSATGSSGQMGTDVDTLNIGKEGNNTSFLNGHIKSLQYYPRRLTDAQLQELTS